MPILIKNDKIYSGGADKVMGEWISGALTFNVSNVRGTYVYNSALKLLILRFATVTGSNISQTNLFNITQIPGITAPGIDKTYDGVWHEWSSTGAITNAHYSGLTISADGVVAGSGSGARRFSVDTIIFVDWL